MKESRPGSGLAVIIALGLHVPYKFCCAVIKIDDTR